VSDLGLDGTLKSGIDAERYFELVLRREGFGIEHTNLQDDILLGVDFRRAIDNAPEPPFFSVR